MVNLLIEAIFLTAANYLLVLYLTDITVDGPFYLFKKIRALAGLRPVYMNDISGGREITGSTHNGKFLAKVLDCHRCASPYTAAGLIVLAWIVGFTEVSWYSIFLWLAVTGTTIFLFENQRMD